MNDHLEFVPSFRAFSTWSASCSDAHCLIRHWNGSLRRREIVKEVLLISGSIFTLTLWTPGVFLATFAIKMDVLTSELTLLDVMVILNFASFGFSTFSGFSGTSSASFEKSMVLLTLSCLKLIFRLIFWFHSMEDWLNLRICSLELCLFRCTWLNFN